MGRWLRIAVTFPVTAENFTSSWRTPAAPGLGVVSSRTAAIVRASGVMMAARQYGPGPLGVAIASLLSASRLVPGAAVSSSRTSPCPDPAQVNARVLESAAQDSDPTLTPPKPNPIPPGTHLPHSLLLHVRSVPVARSKTYSLDPIISWPMVAASWLPSGDRARPSRPMP